MKESCSVCSRNLGVAYHGKLIKKNFCCRKCETYFKMHFCTMHKENRVKNSCQNKIYKSSKKFCSEACEHEYFNKGRKISEFFQCTKCSKTKKYFEYRARGIGLKDPIGLFRQSYCRDCENQNQKDQRVENPIHRLFLLSKKKTKKDNLDFDLTEDFIKTIWPQNNKCPILDTEFSSGMKDKDALPTIDKVVPQKGYTKGNIVIISFKANSIKSDVTNIELFRKLYDFYKNF